MWIAVLCVVIGIFGGFGSVSRGSFFNTLAGVVLVGLSLPAMIGLSVAFAWNYGWLPGVGLLAFSWLVAGRFGARVLYRGIDRVLPGEVPTAEFVAEAHRLARKSRETLEKS